MNNPVKAGWFTSWDAVARIPTGTLSISSWCSCEAPLRNYIAIPWAGLLATSARPTAKAWVASRRAASGPVLRSIISIQGTSWAAPRSLSDGRSLWATAAAAVPVGGGQGGAQVGDAAGRVGVEGSQNPVHERGVAVGRLVQQGQVEERAGLRRGAGAAAWQAAAALEQRLRRCLRRSVGRGARRARNQRGQLAQQLGFVEGLGQGVVHAGGERTSRHRPGRHWP